MRNEVGSVRFEKVTVIRMIHVEPWSNSNDVNGGKDFRERETVLALRTVALTSNIVASEVKKVLG